MSRGNFKDLIGKRFGRFLVIKETEKRKNNQIVWLCKCDCGNNKEIRSSNLVVGTTKSCGCLRKELKTTHGMYGIRLNRIWAAMIQRCSNSNHSGYRLYGNRGIKVCERWHKFENFYEDMKEDYSDNLSIDRINNNGDYEPSNCRWATNKEQANNKKTNRLITYENKTQNVKQWAEELNIKWQSLFARLNRNWTIERAFNQPIRSFNII